ncbi:MAG TPA: 4Fe-4S dicluster domain-containing protein [Planctomycetes bacterium]|nr:4Fe-4S dicluster domain-containing protein [Planctomycetota bacterium]
MGGHGDKRETVFTLNGETVVAHGAETVLDVARRLGVHIPTLCHHEAVTAYGACRLCLVEVSWGKRSKLVTSCLYQPYENDAVETDSARVHAARRMVLEMLLARCPDVEVIRDMGKAYGVAQSRFPSMEAPGPSGCILCGLCVRVCDEVVGASAIGYANRGTQRYVSTPHGDNADACIGCGACVFVCPTGALHLEDKDGIRTMVEFNTSMPMVKCGACGEYFATEKQLRAMLEKTQVPEETALKCPKCRGADFTGIAGKALLALQADAGKTGS